ncbi:uncharacterized protein LOC122510720 [Leptopilina heterotoma]|uniref:uncharacterized protein LOC122510720 n=1 Tax=Leptopilina heterotoma TaxID=63436 RepID=UPI001CA90ABF|nr:uncharacterized protein LOC122510720 [Leptopilina heterotoma]
MTELRNSGFLSLLYSIGDKPLNLWSKYISPDGKICRVIDDFLNGDKVIEITGPHNVPVCTKIICPADPTDILNIKLPILVLIIKNLQIRLKLEFQILDKEKFRRKFSFLNEEISPKIGTTVARLPLKLEEDWNNLEINLQNLCHDTFGTDYDALQRIVIYSNCHIRRVYLQDRHYEHNEISGKLFQAFFDMYLLKWGIDSVDRTSQTENFKNTETLQVNNTQTAPISTNQKNPLTRNSGAKQKIRQFSTNSKQIKITKKEEKNSTKKLKKPENNEKEEKKSKVPQIPISNKNEKLPKNEQNFSQFEKSKYLQAQKIPFPPNDEGNIFSKWPYKFDDLPQKTQSVTKINDPIINNSQNLIQNSQKKIEQIIPKNPSKESLTKKPITTNFQNYNVRKIKNILNEIHKIKQHLNNKNYKFNFSVGLPSDSDSVIPEFVELEAKTLEKKLQSKLLTSDLIVNELLKSRLNLKMIFEKLKKKGFSMKNMELSIQNPVERKNAYGQGKLIANCRESLNKATNCEEISKLKSSEKMKIKLSEN